MICVWFMLMVVKCLCGVLMCVNVFICSWLCLWFGLMRFEGVLVGVLVWVFVCGVVCYCFG